MSVDPYANRGGSGSFPPSLQRPSNSSTQQREAQGSPRRGQSPTRNLNSPRRNLPPHLAARSAQFSSSTDEEAAFGGGMMNNTAATAPNYIISTATGAISEEQPPTIPYAHTPGYSYRKESGDMSGSKLSPPTSDGSLSPAEVGVMKSEASRVNAAAHPPQHNVGGAVQAPRGVYMVDVESYLPPSEQRIEEGSLSASSKHPLRLCPQTACPQASSCTPSTLPGGPQFGKNATSLPASCYEAATQRPPGKCSSLISLALALFFMYVTMSLASQALYQTNKTQATMEAERALGIKKGRETIYLPSEMIKLARWTKVGPIFCIISMLVYGLVVEEIQQKRYRSSLCVFLVVVLAPSYRRNVKNLSGRLRGEAGCPAQHVLEFHPGSVGRRAHHWEARKGFAAAGGMGVLFCMISDRSLILRVISDTMTKLTISITRH